MELRNLQAFCAENTEIITILNDNCTLDAFQKELRNLLIWSVEITEIKKGIFIFKLVGKRNISKFKASGPDHNVVQ